METSKTPLEYVSEVTELNEIHEFMQDPIVDEAMGIIVKLYVREGLVPPHKVARLIVQLQALAAQCALKAKYYQMLNKDANKKNIYYTLEDSLTNLVNAIKYTTRVGA